MSHLLKDIIMSMLKDMNWKDLEKANDQLRREVDSLRYNMVDFIEPKRRGPSGWWWVFIILSFGLGLLVAAAWWLYGSDDDDLFDEFDDFGNFDTDNDLPNAKEAMEKAKDNASQMVDDISDKIDETVDLNDHNNR